MPLFADGTILHPLYLVQLHRELVSEDKHEIGKKKTQKIEQKHICLRTRIKRLARKTICFSKSEETHDLVVGLYEIQKRMLQINEREK